MDTAWLSLHSLNMLIRNATLHSNRLVGMHIQPHLAHRIHPRQRIRPVKDLGHLLQALALGLREEEKDQHKVHANHTAPDDIIPPRNRIHGHGVGKRVVDPREVAGQLVHHARLGAQRVRHDFHDVRRRHGRTRMVRGAEQEDHDQHARRIALILEVVFLVQRRADRPDDVGDAHAAHAAEEEPAATGAVDQSREEGGGQERPDGEAGVDDELDVRVRHVDGVEDLGEVVRGQPVAGPLQHGGDVERQKQAVPVAPGRDPLRPAGGALDLLHFERGGDFGHFEADEAGRGVPVGVVFGQHGERFLAAAVVDEPAGGLRGEQAEHGLDEREDALQDAGDAPAPAGVGHLEGAVGDPGGDEGAQRPGGEIEGDELASLGRVGDLGQERRGGGSDDAQPQADQEARDHEHAVVDGGGLDDRAQDDDERAAADGVPAAEALAQLGGDQHGDQDATGWAKRHGAETGAGWFAKVLVPLREGLHAVEHAAVVSRGDLREEGTQQKGVELEEGPIPVEGRAFGSDILEREAFKVVLVWSLLSIVVRSHRVGLADGRVCWWIAGRQVRKSCMGLCTHPDAEKTWGTSGQFRSQSSAGRRSFLGVLMASGRANVLGRDSSERRDSGSDKHHRHHQQLQRSFSSNLAPLRMTVDIANHQIQSKGSQPLERIFSESVLAKILRVAVEALDNNDPPTEYPEFVPQKGPSTGRYVLRESSFWTCGFFPGLLYVLLERAIQYPSAFPYLGHPHSLDPASLRDHLVALCTKWTAPIYPMSLRTDTHDLGFILAPSLRRSWELTANPNSLRALLTGAQSLASRFVPATGAIRSWDVLRQSDVDITSLETDCLVIIDSMMNLDLLYYAAAHLGPQLAAIATTHAKTLLHSHLRRETIPGTARAGYSTIHVVNFDPATGAIKERRTAQGYAADSTWARGQAWAITGYAQTYAWTRDRQFLDVAIGLAEYFLARLEGAPPCVEQRVDGRRVGRYVPLWDFDAPVDEASPLRDSSAGVIAANGMLLLSQALVGADDGLARRFREAAMRIVSETVECSYSREEARLVDGGKQVEDVSGSRFDAILRNATANHNAKDLDRYSDHGLVYADYYLLEFGNQLLKLGLI